MRKTLLMVMLLGISSQVEAQQLSAGYKTGITNWMRVNTNSKGPVIGEVTDGAKTSWNNELFIRYQGKGNWAFEGGISHTKRDMDGISYILGCWGGASSRQELENMTSTEVNLGIQYKINIPGAAKCPLLKNLSNYIGILVSPQVVNIATDYTYTGGDPLSMMQHQDGTRNNKYVAIFAGINHTLIYRVSKHLNAVSTVNLKMNTGSMYNVNANTRLGLNIGASYNL